MLGKKGWVFHVCWVICVLVFASIVHGGSIQEAIIATGNFTLDRNIVNFAKYDIKTHT